MSLQTKFEAVCCLTTFLEAQTGRQKCDANNLLRSASKQAQMQVELADLAKFRYLLPEEISFEYQDTPFDPGFGSAPMNILVFEFKDKRAQTRPKDHISRMIQARIVRFRSAFNKFLETGHTEDELSELSLRLIPRKPFEEVQQMEMTYSQDPQEALDAIRAQLEDGCIVHRTVPGRPPRYGPAPECMKQELADAGFDKLYLHQSIALKALIDENKHLVVTTTTASGKSLIFHSAVLHALRIDPEAKALFIYPTKALAQDQLRAFAPLAEIGTCATFDGDTPMEDRDRIANEARVIFCNPDIIHATMLPQASKWHEILGGLRYIVLDEIHYYGGIFGAHVSMVIRRLRRMAATFGSDPLLIGCSATMEDPAQHMATLTGLSPETDLKSVGPEDDGAPAGAKHYIFRTTEYMTPDDPSSGRKHPVSETAPALAQLVRRGLRTIAFTRFRKECELLLRAVYDQNEDLNQAVRAYRGGYSALDRRAIEAEMFSGELRGIVATTALEVGIDIGDLDAVIVQGFPHSLASFRQQVGRVGRRQRDSIVLYVADGSVMDQAYAHDIGRVIDDPVPHTPIPTHDSIIRSHIRCAANELAFSGVNDPDFELYFPKFDLTKAKLNKAEDNSLYWPERPTISLRKGNESETVVIDITNKDKPRILESVEFRRVAFTLYEGAIFVHQGRPYIVVQLDGDLEFAKVQRTTVKWSTRQRDYTDIDPLKSKSNRLLAEQWPCSRGSVRVKTVVFGYFKFDNNNRIIDAQDVNVPPCIATRAGLWINLPSEMFVELAQRNHHIAGAVHGAEHAIMSVMPMFVAMAPDDVATECKAPEREFSGTQTQRIRPARLIFHENSGGNEWLGILESAYTQLEAVVAAACDAVDTCKCSLGCVGCVASGYCTEHNAVLSKRGAQVILRTLLQRSLDGIPIGPEPNLPRPKVETMTAVGAITTTLGSIPMHYDRESHDEGDERPLKRNKRE